MGFLARVREANSGWAPFQAIEVNNSSLIIKNMLNPVVGNRYFVQNAVGTNPWATKLASLPSRQGWVI